MSSRINYIKISKHTHIYYVIYWDGMQDMFWLILVNLLCRLFFLSLSFFEEKKRKTRFFVFFSWFGFFLLSSSLVLFTCNASLLHTQVKAFPFHVLPSWHQGIGFLNVNKWQPRATNFAYFSCAVTFTSHVLCLFH